MNRCGGRTRTLTAGASFLLVVCAAFLAGRHVGMNATGASSSVPQQFADTDRMKALDAVQKPSDSSQIGAVNYLWTPVGRMGTPVERTRQPVSLPELDSSEEEPQRYLRRPIGQLGKPVGTFMTIQGERPKDAYKIGNCLLVTQINGKQLENPVPVSVEGKDVSEVIGTQIMGYETGKMIGGPPPGIAIKGPRAQKAGAWEFYCRFVVVEPDKLEPNGLQFNAHVMSLQW